MREFSPRPFRHRRTIELCLVMFLVCFLGYNYLERYWIPEVSEPPESQYEVKELAEVEQPPEWTFDEGIYTGFFIDVDGNWQGVLNGIEIDLTNSFHNGSSQEIAISISGDWDCYLMIDDECVIEP